MNCGDDGLDRGLGAVVAATGGATGGATTAPDGAIEGTGDGGGGTPVAASCLAAWISARIWKVRAKIFAGSVPP
jgi:hypothetical protein